MKPLSFWIFPEALPGQEKPGGLLHFAALACLQELPRVLGKHPALLIPFWRVAGFVISGFSAPVFLPVKPLRFFRKQAAVLLPQVAWKYFQGLYHLAFNNQLFIHLNNVIGFTI